MQRIENIQTLTLCHELHLGYNLFETCSSRSGEQSFYSSFIAEKLLVAMHNAMKVGHCN